MFPRLPLLHGLPTQAGSLVRTPWTKNQKDIGSSSWCFRAEGYLLYISVNLNIDLYIGVQDVVANQRSELPAIHTLINVGAHTASIPGIEIEQINT